MLKSLKSFKGKISIIYRPFQDNNQEKGSQNIQLGMELINTLNYEEARQIFDQAICQNYFKVQFKQYRLGKTNPQNADYFRLALRIISLMKYEGAILNPISFSNRLNKIQIRNYNNLERLEEAIQRFDYAILLNPKDADAYNNKGIGLRNLKRHEDAIQIYDKAMNPQDVFKKYEEAT